MHVQSESPLQAGKELPSLTLPEAGGGLVRTWDFHGRENLILVLASDPTSASARHFLEKLALSYEEIRTEETEVLPIVRASLTEADDIKRMLGWKGRIMVDETGEVFSRYGVAEQVAVIIADRYGEIYYRTDASIKEIPSIEEVLSWLRFIQSQCPE